LTRKNEDPDSEKERIEQLKQYEYQAYKDGFQYIAGIDEAGRGPLAGPVAAGAVILPPNFYLPGVDDSKKLSPPKRTSLAGDIKRMALSWAVGFVFPPYLDKVNILNATREAMRMAVQELVFQPDLLLIDALRIPGLSMEQYSIIKGDALSISIACASILAKVERDLAMEAFDKLYPGYGFAKHKGYATKEHFTALLKLGPCPIHRKSFEPVRSMVEGGKYEVQPELF
jgi:ribonuclease HII